MRRPFILSLFRNVLGGTIMIAAPHARLHAQMKSQTGAPPGELLPSSHSVTLSVTDLPDSPGTILRRREQSSDNVTETDNVAETASISGAGVVSGTPQQSDQTATPQQSGRSDPPAGAAASVSNKAQPAACPAGNGVAGDGIVTRKTNGPSDSNATPGASSNVPGAASIQPPLQCPPAQNPYRRFLNSNTPIPLTPRQKGYLAIRNFIDPGNIVTILGTSGIAIASDSHTAYGPGWRGFGRDAGISAVQDATGDFFGTFLIPSIAHEDPHYHRMPNASIARRTLHAISRTVIAQGDDGHPMPNYSTLLTYPITAEIANLYVPGVATNGPSTAERILTGYATDPIDNLITEFLPDVAKRIHVRVIFVQQIINQVAAGQPVSVF